MAICIFQGFQTEFFSKQNPHSKVSKSGLLYIFIKLKQKQHMAQKNMGLPSSILEEDKTKSRQMNLGDSLRFSYQFDCDSALEYSEDGQQIDFVFQQFPQYQNHGSNHFNQIHKQVSSNSSVNSNTSRRLDLFQKYKIKGEQQHSKSSIIDEFDSIFNMKGQNTSAKQHSYLFRRKKSIQQKEDSSKIIRQNEDQKSELVQNRGAQEEATNTIAANGNNENIFFLGNVQQNNPATQQNKQINLNVESGKVIQQINGSKKMGDFCFEKTFSTTSEELISNDSSTTIHDPSPSTLNNLQLNQNKNQARTTEKKNEQKEKEASSSQPPQKPNIVFTFKSVQSSGEVPSNIKSKSQMDQQYNKSVELVLKKSQQSSTTETESSIQTVELDTSRNKKMSYLGEKRTQSEGSQAGSILSIPVVIKTSRPVTPRNLGKSIILESTDPQFKLANPIFEQQNRITPFLRKIRKMNSIYPNFNHPASNLDNESKFCNLLASIFEEAFKYLQKLMNAGFQRRRQYKYFQPQYASLHYFLNSQWEKQKQKQLDQLNITFRPKANFLRNEINQEKIRSAMKNYQQVIAYYKAKKIQLSDEQGIKNYFKIRQKFWSLQRNLRSISEDVYRLFLQSQLPQFYFDYVTALKSPLPAKTDEKTILYHEKVLNALYTNRQRKQPLSSSQVGLAVKDKLERQLKFLSHI